jgi:hypothetical protein
MVGIDSGVGRASDRLKRPRLLESIAAKAADRRKLTLTGKAPPLGLREKATLAGWHKQLRHRLRRVLPKVLAAERAGEAWPVEALDLVKAFSQLAAIEETGTNAARR